MPRIQQNVEPIDLYGVLPDEPAGVQAPPPRRSRRLWPILGAAAGLVLAGGVIAWKLAPSAAPQAVFASVDRGDVVRTITATGRVQAVQTVQVGSQISGRIAALYVDYNDHVRKGQVIARLESDQLEAQLAQARANLLAAQSGIGAAQGSVLSAEAAVEAAAANVERLRAAMEDARRTADRNAELYKAGVLARQALDSSVAAAGQAAAQYNQAVAQQNQSKSQLVTVRAQLGAARAQEAQARAAVEMAVVNLNHAVITAPVDGVVIARNVDVGQTVAASLQAPTLFVIANDLSKMQVLADIDEADVGQLAPGAKVTFTVDAFPRDTFHGTIQQVRLNPQTVQNVVTYTAVINVDNPDLKLRPGMTASVTAVTAEARNVLRIPNAALRFRPETRAVWKANGAELVPVRIQPGLTDGSYTEVRSGELREGDRVAIAQAPQSGRQQPRAGFSPFGGRPGRAR